MTNTPDVLARNVPAVSSTSDMPGTGQAATTPPTSATNETAAAKAASDKAASDKAAADAASKAAADKTAGDAAAKAAADKAAADKAAAEAGKTPEQIAAEKAAAEADGKKKSGINERFSDITREKKEAIARAEVAETARVAAEKRADELAASLDTINKKLDKVIPPDPANVRPDRAKFDDPAKYDEALIAWSSKMAADKAKAEAEVDFKKKSEADQQKAKEEAAKAEVDRTAKAWAERTTEFAKTNPDFEEVAKNEAVQITPTMGMAILHSEKGPDLAYHLGKNPELAAKIAALPAAQQLMQLGVLEHSLSQPPKTTTAPDPITPIKGGNTPAPKAPSEMSMDEYAAHRAAKK